MDASLQDRFGPNTVCFGCGPANYQGLQIKSFVRGDEVVADFNPSPEHQAFPGAVSGGILGTLFDCHMNWTGAYYLMQSNGLVTLPATVTADLHFRLKRPTPHPGTIHVRARVVEAGDDRVRVEAEIEAGGKVTATAAGTFVAVKEGHPAYHRWE